MIRVLSWGQYLLLYLTSHLNCLCNHSTSSQRCRGTAEQAMASFAGPTQMQTTGNHTSKPFLTRNALNVYVYIHLDIAHMQQGSKVTLCTPGRPGGRDDLGLQSTAPPTATVIHSSEFTSCSVPCLSRCRVHHMTKTASGAALCSTQGGWGSVKKTRCRRP